MLLNSQKEIEHWKKKKAEIKSCIGCKFFQEGERRCTEQYQTLCNQAGLSLEPVNYSLSVPQRFRSAIDKDSEAWEKFSAGKNLFLYGPTGTGKTHEAWEIAKCFYIKNYPFQIRPGERKTIAYISEEEFFKKLKDFRLYSREKEYSHIFSVDLIIWDEFGDAKDEQVERYRLVNDIYINQRPRVIFTTNQDISSLPDIIGSKTADRLYDICEGGTVEFSGGSLRGRIA